jgi:two-component system response regulator FimZ (fimbrial Z protein)
MLSMSPATRGPTSSLIERVRTLIVDDHPRLRLDLRERLARQPEFDVVADAGSVAEAIAYLAHHTFDVAIVGLVLPDGRGVAVIDHVVNVQPDCKVLGLSTVDDPTQMAEMLRAGASGFVLKSQCVDEVVEALHCVIAGGRSVPAAAREQIASLVDRADARSLERLTPQEREVFELVVAGHSNDGIAANLVISRRMVDTHRVRIMTKLGARSLGELLQLARRHCLAGGRERQVP